jgi:hypothetical protein
VEFVVKLKLPSRHIAGGVITIVELTFLIVYLHWVFLWEYVTLNECLFDILRDRFVVLVCG